MKRFYKSALRGVAAAAALGALLLGCSNVFAPRVEKREPRGSGTGIARIDIAGASSASRTLLPVAGGFSRHDLLFKDQDALLPDVSKTNYTSNSEITLNAGTWTVTVSAYLPDGGSGERLAAQGEATVVVADGVAGDPVPVALSPIEHDYTGTGTFAWNLSFPASTIIVTMAITDLSDNVVQTLSLKGPANHGTLYQDGDGNGGSIDLSAGTYYIQTTLTLLDGGKYPKARRKDALFILGGLATTADAAAGYAFAADSFSRTIYVTSDADSGPGSLRQAIADADNDVVQVALPPGSVIALASSLASAKSMTIEGNGVTLTPASGFSDSLWKVSTANIDVVMRRIHFKGGRTSGNGAAINRTLGHLALESCVFSDNQAMGASSQGGAVYAVGATSNLTVLGCTFYNNYSPYSAGAIHNTTTVPKLGGNLFYRNTASGSSNVFGGLTTASVGYNVSDFASGTNATTGSGFTFLETDCHDPDGMVSSVSFAPALGSHALGKVDVGAFNTANPSLPYPAQDFYGNPIPADASAANAGAVQGGGGYALNVITQGPGQVAGIPFNSDGLLDPGASSFVLTASPTGSAQLVSLMVNGEPQSGNTYAVSNMEKNLDLVVVFGTESAVATGEEFLQALADPDCGVISLSADISLTAQANITRSIVIEGNGKTITSNGLASTSKLLQVDGKGVRAIIRRVHFKDRVAPTNGAVVYNNNGSIVLESCVFSNNQNSTASGANGYGWVYTTGLQSSLTALGCTFYNNKAMYGGAIYVGAGTLRLGGNLFYGNTATNSGKVVYSGSTATVVSLGYNVSDLPGGAGNNTTTSGFVFVSTDSQTAEVAGVSPLTFKPALESYALGKVDVAAFNTANPGLSYPTQDFYGNPIPASAANAGAAQGGGTGHSLTVVIQGPGEVTGMPFNSDGLVASGASFTITASPSTVNDTLASLTVDGTAQAGNTYSVIGMTKSLEVQAVFAGTYQVANEAELIAALANTNCSAISLSKNGLIISARVDIQRSIVIEGNGATITTTLAGHLRVYTTGTVVIQRVHFRGGIPATMA